MIDSKNEAFLQVAACSLTDVTFGVFLEQLLSLFFFKCEIYQAILVESKNTNMVWI